MEFSPSDLLRREGNYIKNDKKPRNHNSVDPRTAWLYQKKRAGCEHKIKEFRKEVDANKYSASNGRRPHTVSKCTR